MIKIYKNYNLILFLILLIFFTKNTKTTENTKKTNCINTFTFNNETQFKVDIFIKYKQKKSILFIPYQQEKSTLISIDPYSTKNITNSCIPIEMKAIIHEQPILFPDSPENGSLLKPLLGLPQTKPYYITTSEKEWMIYRTNKNFTWIISGPLWVGYHEPHSPTIFNLEYLFTLNEQREFNDRYKH